MCEIKERKKNKLHIYIYTDRQKYITKFFSIIITLITDSTHDKIC